jgi:hypothetical protein
MESVGEMIFERIRDDEEKSRNSNTRNNIGY